MLNQVAVEALYSATYVENYLDCVENLPDDVQRHLTRMRELDVTYRACLRDVENNLHNCMLPKDESNTTQTNKRNRAIAKIQQSLIAAQELGDEKLQVVQLLQDLIDHKSRQLDLDYRNLISCLDYGNGTNIKEEPMSVDVPTSTGLKESSGGGSEVRGGGGGTASGVGGGGAGGGGAQQQAPVVQGAGGANNSSGAGARTPSSPQHNHERDRDRGEKDRTGERASKRARRSRNETVSGADRGDNDRGGNTGGRGGDEGRGNGEGGGREREREPPAPAPPPPPPPQPELPQQRNSSGNSSNNKKAGTGKLGTGKKKKRKSRQSAQSSQRDETPPPEDPDPIDPDEPTYCLCDQISFGEMILCDNDLCPIEWFHFSCVSLSTKPKGKWFCPKCRGDRPNVMKPKSQFLKELERYNKEREEKA